jgi:hypothetical protein
MFNRFLLGLVLFAFAGSALADGIINPKANGIDQREGINNLGIGGGSTPPVGCSGTIDLSTGCVAPMLGAL